MKYLTLAGPTLLVLLIIYDLGNPIPASVVSGKTIVVAIVTGYGMWFGGFLTGKFDK